MTANYKYKSNLLVEYPIPNEYIAGKFIVKELSEDVLSKYVFLNLKSENFCSVL